MKFAPFVFCLFLFEFVRAQTIDSVALNNFRDAVLELQNSELMRSGSLAISIKSVKEEVMFSH
jgi:D-alanyl-D-alanine carboxypeptidase/D-alanyl-D-alanine-endopeptidase (penicillin-binding protein 4)